jgi:hypothetical protein
MVKSRTSYKKVFIYPVIYIRSVGLAYYGIRDDGDDG